MVVTVRLLGHPVNINVCPIVVRPINIDEHTTVVVEIRRPVDGQEAPVSRFAPPPPSLRPHHPGLFVESLVADVPIQSLRRYLEWPLPQDIGDERHRPAPEDFVLRSPISQQFGVGDSDSMLFQTAAGIRGNRDSDVRQSCGIGWNYQRRRRLNPRVV